MCAKVEKDLAGIGTGNSSYAITKLAIANAVIVGEIFL